MLRVGLTGGIASGKSTVAGLFAARGIPVVDADEIAHALMQPGQPVLARVFSTFGDTVIAAGGVLDRGRLRSIVFADPGQRKILEAIVHPPVMREMQARMDALDSPYCIACIPLLVEAGLRHAVDRVLLVDCPVSQQQARLAGRDALDGPEIDAVIRAQAGRRERIAVADDIIHNDGGMDSLDRQVQALHQAYLDLAGG